MGDVIDLKPKGWTDDLLNLPAHTGPLSCPNCGEDITAEPTVAMIPWLGCGRCVDNISDRMLDEPPDGWSLPNGGANEP